jgi:asparagine synthase (glutamine-hydrolysing)
MCGICGIVQLGGEPRPVVAPETLDWMTDVMVHRGPNDRGTYSAPGIALGVRRLSVIDVEGGHQPFSNEDGSIWAVQNGELYNHVELRRELRGGGHTFHSRCDTEVLPHLYERDGEAFEARLRGKFGLAVWDSKQRRAVIARDQFGIKPLYYAVVGDLLVFASELKSLLASGIVPLDLDYSAIDAFLSLGFVPGPSTPLAAVSKLLPGHRLVAGGGGVRLERYWDYPAPEPRTDGAGVDEVAEELLEQIEESVRLRLMSDVPVGAMLSGGIDSSLIVALMARNMTEPVKTFSVGFAEAGEANELADARLVASMFGTDHHEMELSLSKQAVDLTDLVWQLDEPLADLSPLGFLLLCELAAKHVTVALSGQGADELLGGYNSHRSAVVAGAWQKLPRPLRAVGIAALRRGPPRVRRKIPTLTAPDPVTRMLAMSSRLDPALRGRLVRGPLAELPGDAAFNAIASRLHGVEGDALATNLYLDGQLALVDDMLHYFDRASMAHSLEVRVPLCDPKIAAYCATIPSGLKVRRLETKHVLKVAARGLIPDRVIDKPKVGFFANSVDAWFRAQTDGALATWLVGSDHRYAEILDPDVVGELVSRHLDRSDTKFLKLLISILMLEIWLGSFLQRAVAGPPAPAREQVRIPA